MSDEEEGTSSEEEEAEETGQTQKTEQTIEPPQGISASEKPASELKVVIILKASRAMLGVQSPDCDPVYKTMEGDLATVLQVVPTLVADAKLQWAAAPRYPKADLPKPVVPATTTTPAASKSAAKAAPAQPKFF